MKSVISILVIIMFTLATGCTGPDDPEENMPDEGKTESLSGAETEKEEPSNSSTTVNDFKDEDYPESDVTENRPPVVKSINVETLTANPRDGFRVNVISEDPDGDSVDYIYQWKLNGEDIYGATDETLKWRDDFSKGDQLTIEVIPFDEEAEGVWKSEGTFTIPNAPPVIKSTPEGAVTGNSFSYRIIAEDPDGDPFTLSLENAPEDMVLNSETGEISWTFGSEDSGDYSIDIIATDEEGSYSIQNVQFTISGDN